MASRFLMRGALVATLAGVVASCSTTKPPPTPPPKPITFGKMGSLTQASGKGTFRFGAASAATQVEDQNTNTDWYVFTEPQAMGGLGNATFVGDAAKGYTMSMSDIALMKSLGIDSFRFSMEWARIEPKRGQIDEAALKHYSDFIDALIANGIKPLVTIHHFSNPTWVDDPRDPNCTNGPSDTNLCGLGHPVGGPLVIQAMADHAKLLAQRFGDRVDEWGTVNEPVNYLLAAYGVGQFPPGKKYVYDPSDLSNKFMPVVRDYLRAHAAMYHAIKQYDTIDADGDGVAADVGLSLSVGEWVPARGGDVSKDPADIAARDKVVYVYHHLLIDSIENGNFDMTLSGTPDTSLPDIKGTLDWLGLQYYFRAGVTSANGLILGLTPCFAGLPAGGACIPPATDKTHCIPKMKYEWYEPGIYDILKDFSARYPNIPLLVSESGIATDVGKRRSEHIVRSLEQIAKARDEGVDVRGYYHWSLYDNFEWTNGFDPHFGLYSVDYGSYARTPTDGATTLAAIIANRTLTTEMRQTMGGMGPLTPEPGEMPGATCSDY